MKFSDIFNGLLIIIVFIILHSAIKFLDFRKHIRNNWPQHRCNPAMMPFASQLGPPGTDAGLNHSQCVQTNMKSNMPTLMAPTHYISSLVSGIAGDITGGINAIRKVFNYVKNMIMQIVKKIVSIFMNILIEILHMIINMKDLASKIMGVMATLLFMIDGMVKTGTGVWAGTLGEVARFLCFHPETPLILQNGKRSKMSEIQVGDILENGSKVLGTLKLEGSPSNPYYKIHSGVMNSDIYVTGSHFVFDKSTERFIQVQELSDAIRTTKSTKHMSCLITNDHLIPIGEHLFWDWEDGT